MRSLLLALLLGCPPPSPPADTGACGAEVCNGTDDDCDGEADEGLTLSAWPDGDGDGWGAGEPVQACAVPSGHAAEDGDCDDADPAVHPGAEETCNGVDDDCDGAADGGVLGTWYADTDGDGFGDPATVAEACGAPAGFVADGTDCDDADPSVHPGADEGCDGDDDDCDGVPDLGAESTWYRDEDGDGWGHPAVFETTCAPEEGWVQRGGDCDPADPTVHPEAVETCDGDDQDCDGAVDEDFDLDADGFQSVACAAGTDCEDGDGAVHPGAQDPCGDGVDGDCDGRDTTCGYAGVLSLAAADLALWSSGSSWDAGRLVEVGDLDGDGAIDVVLPTYTAYSANGGAYVLPGPLAASGDLDAAGHHLAGSADTYNAGRSAGVGDSDGDGRCDLLIGAPHSTDGDAYLFLGPVTADAWVADADVLLRGPPNTEFGHGSDLADVDGDGLADAVVGAYEDLGMAGAVYVALAPFSATVDVARDADAVLEGIARGDQTGNVIDAGDDLDGDGVGDLLAPASTAATGGPNSGCVFVVHGPPAGTIGLSAADGILVGEAAGAQAGQALAMGDLDGDGLSDAVVSGLDGSVARGAGAVYVVAGPATGTLDLGAAALIVRGAATSQSAGSGVDAADVDGDGVEDLLIGAAGDTTTAAGAGAAFLFFGPLAGTWSVTDADATFVGESASDAAGQGVAIADLDGDGWGEMLIGAPGDSTGAPSGGALFVQFPDY